MPDVSVKLAAGDVNHAVTEQVDVNNWGTFESFVLARLQHHAQTAAAHVTAVHVDASVISGKALYTFKVTSNVQLAAPQIKAALR